MSRVKKGLAARKHRKYTIKRAKGFLNDAHHKFRAAKERLLKAETNSYRDRKRRKREFRSLWIVRINGALDEIGSDLSYSRFINLLKKSELKDLNRKTLSEIAFNNIEDFRKIVEKVQA
jgi:large subunit ribosomal protein L20